MCPRIKLNNYHSKKKILNAFTIEWKYNVERLKLKKEVILTKNALFRCDAQAMLLFFTFSRPRQIPIATFISFTYHTLDACARQ